MQIKSYLSETEIHRHIRLMTLSALAAAAILLAFVLATTHMTQRVFDSSYRAQVQAYNYEFALAVKKQSTGDMNTLNTLTQFIHSEKDLSKRNVRSSQTDSQFDLIGFWDTDGGNSQVSLSGTRIFSHFNNMYPEIQKVVISAWNGQSAISEPFFDDRLNQSSIAYAAPVLDSNGQPVAAISATKNLNSFDALLSQLNFHMPNVNLFLVNKNGFVMANNNNIFDITHLDNIKSIRGLSPSIIKEIDNALTTGKDYTTHFSYQNSDYTMNLIPMDYQGWFTTYIDHTVAEAAPVYASLRTLVYILMTILVIIVLSGGAAFFIIRRSYLQQLAVAFYDPLTESYNSRKFSLELHKKLCHGNSERYSLISLGLRDFTFISDYLGQSHVNALIKLISEGIQEMESLVQFCRSQDDRFYILLNTTDHEQITAQLQKFFQEIAAIFEQTFSLFPVTFQAGVVISGTADNEKTLTRKADFVLGQITKSYTHVVRFYDENSYQSELNIKQLEIDMRPALEHGEFKLYLQPKIDLKSRRISAAEALVRWQKPDGSMIFPGAFIPLFENNGFCAELDLYIFEQVCKQIRKWLDEGKEPIPISVNQSKLLLFRPNYIESVQSLLQRYQVPSHCIIIEILESIVAQDVVELNDYMKKLRSIGLSISMDDFGAGYSSLNMLSSLEVDEIKFDKEFLLEPDAAKKEKNKIILCHLMNLAQQFKVKTVVEGVESATDVEFLSSLNCNLAQGFYFNKPIDLETFDKTYMQEQQRE